MSDPKIVIGLVTLVIGTVSYSLYFKDLFAARTKPDGFSWFIWGVLAGITFFAQMGAGGGAGAWATAFTSVVCFLIASFAFAHGGRAIRPVDWISLGGALAAVIVWVFTNDPLLAVILVIAVGAFGFIPTFFKAFAKPKEETAATFALNAIKFAVALFALGSLNPVTWLYPAALTAMNASLATMLFVRRA